MGMGMWTDSQEEDWLTWRYQQLVGRRIARVSLMRSVGWKWAYKSEHQLGLCLASWWAAWWMQFCTSWEDADRSERLKRWARNGETPATTYFYKGEVRTSQNDCLLGKRIMQEMRSSWHTAANWLRKLQPGRWLIKLVGWAFARWWIDRRHGRGVCWSPKSFRWILLYSCDSGWVDHCSDVTGHTVRSRPTVS